MGCKMFVEILQFLSMVLYGNIHLLVLFFAVFVVLPRVMVKVKAKKPIIYEGDGNKKVTVVVPVYKEDPALFRECCKSIRKQKPDQFIVAIDSGDKTLVDIAKENGAEVLQFNTRVGKRQALVEAWKKARNDIVIHVDSDTVLADNCIRELVKPFDKEDIAGVETRHVVVPGNSKMSYVMTNVIEQNRLVNSRGLNGGLVVVDGRCSAWRKSFLLTIADKLVNETWMGVKCAIGDDRFLSREAIKAGYKTTIQESAVVYVRAPDSFSTFVKQQVRWRRSGTKFWLKDLREGVSPSRTYTVKTTTYYLAPFMLLLTVIFDVLFFPTPFKLWGLLLVPLVIIAGTTLVTLMNQLIYFGKPISLKYIVPQALVGLFVMLPASVYGALTIKRQNIWGTRGYDKTGRVFTAVAALLTVMAVAGSLGAAVLAQEGEYL
ncbi:MAG: glycosyltransferase [Candidatus Bathyarchaeota archaeon]|nr:glycosyltransferase [Candidatus Bathyarchaeota archaeon]